MTGELTARDAALIDAVDVKDVARVEQLLAEGANASCVVYADSDEAKEKGEDGLPLLMVAILGGECDIVRLLVTHGAKTSVTVGALTPLMLACERGRVDIVVALLASGVSANTPGAMTLASGAGHCEVVSALILGGGDVNERAIESGAMPLAVAAAEGHADVVALLLANGASPHATTVDGVSPLHAVALRSGSVACARLLLDAGARADLNDSMQRTPFTIALEKNDCALGRAMLERDRSLVDGVHVVHRKNAAGVDDDNVDESSSRNNNGSFNSSSSSNNDNYNNNNNFSNINSKSASNRPFHTPLLFAAILLEHTEFIALLLEHGASLEQRYGRQGLTPVMLAARVE